MLSELDTLSNRNLVHDSVNSVIVACLGLGTATYIIHDSGQKFLCLATYTQEPKAFIVSL